MSLTQILNKLRKILTFKQFSEIADLLSNAAEMSKRHQSEQEVKVTFVNGHPKKYTSTQNSIASVPEIGLDDEPNWGME